MKRFKVMILLGVSGLVLAACGSEDASEGVLTESEAGSSEAEITEVAEETSLAESETTGENNLYEFNEVIADNENFKATLLNIEYVYDDMWDEEKIEVRFDVENKREDSIEAQARSVSLNGRMVDEGLLTMSQEIAPGKVAEAVLEIQDYEGNELPALEGDFEMSLYIFSWDDFEYEEEVPVNVSFE